MLLSRKEYFGLDFKLFNSLNYALVTIMNNKLNSFRRLGGLHDLRETPQQCCKSQRNLPQRLGYPERNTIVREFDVGLQDPPFNKEQVYAVQLIFFLS